MGGKPAQQKSMGMLVQVVLHGVEHCANVITILAA